MLKNIAILCTLVILPVLAQENSCVNPDGSIGFCINLKNCEKFIHNYDSKNITARNFLQLSNRACKKPSPIICCPNEDVVSRTIKPPPITIKPSPLTTRKPAPLNTRKPAPVLKQLLSMMEINPRISIPYYQLEAILPNPGEECGLTNNTFQRVVGGETAKIGGWPWIALIGLTDSLGAISFKCGGVLITRKHILTAAHCIKPELTFVRLGEHDLNSLTETKHIDINVNYISKHPKYSKKDSHSDIAFLKLENSAPNTNFIHPICLPTSQQLKTKSYFKSSLFVAGWGKTEQDGEFSATLQQIQIPVHENSLCRNSYEKQGNLVSNRQFDNKVICAGVLSGGKDTCQGDSGGPLMAPEVVNNMTIYYLIGIVSYGIGCAIPQIPGVYANVPLFMNWIEQQIVENP